MHTVDLLDRAIKAAERLGYRVRQEWLGGNGGGACEIRGQRWLFVDLAQSPADQLAVVAEVLRRAAEAHPVTEVSAENPGTPLRRIA